MTEEQKDILISRMLECPGGLTDQEVAQILEDDELRDIYNISVDVKAAKRIQVDIDASAEWERFMPRLAKPRRWDVGLFARIAAVFVGVLLVSAGIYVARDKETDQQSAFVAENSATDNQSTPPSSASYSLQVNEQSQEQPLHSEKTPKPMLAKATVSQNTETAETVDVDECLRIQQARMDNDLAMECAEAVVNQYYAMADIDGAYDEYPTDIDIVNLIIP